MSEFFVFSTTRQFTKAAAKEIDKAIKTIDASADFVGPLRIPGSKTTGWIERPNDGTNNQNHVGIRNQQMADVARQVLGID